MAVRAQPPDKELCVNLNDLLTHKPRQCTPFTFRPSLIDRWTTRFMVLVCAAGCSNEVTGPTPEVDAALTPGVVCRAQLTTEVSIAGQDFSPVVIDIPGDPKAALPDVLLSRTAELDGSSAEAERVLFSGDPDVATNLEKLQWQSDTEMTLTVTPELMLGGLEVTEQDPDIGMLPVGLFDVLVTNPNDNEGEVVGVLGVVDKPTLEAPSPGITCLAQGPRTIELSGTTFLELDGAEPALEVEGVQDTFEVTDLRDCTDIAHDEVDGKFCEAAEVTLAEDAIEPGYPEITLKNPRTAACSSEEAPRLRVAPPPVIERVVPPLACVAQAERSVQIEGEGFLVIDDTLPTLTLGGEIFAVDTVGECEEVQTLGHSVQTCTQLVFTIEQDALPPGTPEIVVTNPDPAGCSASNAVALRIVPPPEVQSVEPKLICVAEGERSFTVTGNDFLVVDGQAPEVAVGTTVIETDNVGAEDCETIEVDALTVERCSTLVLTIDQEGLAPQLADVRVTNPDPAGCADTLEQALAVVLPPEIQSTSEPLLCTDDGDRTLTIAGTGFIRVGDTLPQVTLDGNPIPVNAISDCVAVGVEGATIEECEMLDVTLPQGSLMDGQALLAVTNPDPAGCTGSSDSVLVGPPSLTLVSATPSGVCQSTGGMMDVVVQGTGLLTIGETSFALEVNGMPVVPTAVSECSTLMVDGLEVQSCNQFTFVADFDTLLAGNVEIGVTNPEPSGCSESNATLLTIAPPPTIAAVTPDNVCSGQAIQLTISGTDFSANANVLAGDMAADSVTFNSATELIANFNSLPAGTYDVTVNNDEAAECTDTAPAALLVDPTPLVFFVDPPVLYNGIEIEATVFTAGLRADASKIELVDENGVATDLPDFSSPLRANRIQASVPAALSAGDYDVRVTSALGCVGGLDGGVQITDNLAIELQSVEPAFASTDANTAVTLLAQDPPPEQTTGFASTPRVYLNAVAADGTAAALRAVVFESAAQLTAVIPEGLTAGEYQLIVVNPTGEVGVLESNIVITETDPPAISAVVPSSVANANDEPVRIVGSGFDPAEVSVRLICLAPGAADPAILDATVQALSATEVTATLPSSGLVSGTVCQVELINGNGSSTKFSAISAKEPAQNLGTWTAGSSLNEARRGLSSVAARATRTSRFVYAIGGDSGALDGATLSVEAAPLDVFGRMGDFTLQRNALPEGRTFADAVTIDNFVYVTGGHDGTAALASTVRAQVLNPLNGIDIQDLDAAPGDPTGLGEGQWFYRLSALYPSTDPSNPGGESLPGEPLTVELPATETGIELTLRWGEAPGASGYRLYRSKTAAGSVDDLELLTELTCGDAPCTCGVDIACEYTDNGQTETSLATPMPRGSLGVWHAGSPLAVAREGHATVVAQNPNNPSEHFIYAFGGRDAAGNVLNSYEFSTVTSNGTGGQSQAIWTASAVNIGIPKADLTAWVLDNNDTNQVSPGEIHIFVGTGSTGLTGGNAFSGEISSGKLDATSTTGELLSSVPGVLDVEAALTPGRAGASGMDASGFLYMVGGTAQSLSGSDLSTQTVAGPDLENWNSLGGGSLTVRRAFFDTVQESAIFFAIGGATDADAASTSVEWAVQ